MSAANSNIIADIDMKIYIPRCVYDWINKMPESKLNLPITGLDISARDSNSKSIEVFPTHIRLNMRSSDTSLSHDDLRHSVTDLKPVISALREVGMLYIRNESTVIRDLEKRIVELEHQLLRYDNTIQVIKTTLRNTGFS